MAAATFTLIASTPYSLKYNIFGDNTGTAGSLNQSGVPSLINDASAGPLRAALEAATTDPLWTALPESAPVGRNALSVTLTTRSADPVGMQFTTGPRAVTVRVPVGAQVTAILEIRIHHSHSR